VSLASWVPARRTRQPVGEDTRLVLSPSLLVRKPHLRQFVGTPGLPGHMLVQLEELHATLLSERFAEIEEPELGQSARGLEERMVLYFP
jgi:hypothetical protein